MLLSLQNLQNANKRLEESTRSPKKRGTRLVALIRMTFAIFFLILELALVFYAISRAMRISDPHERMVHLSLASGATVPYVLMDVFLGKGRRDL